MLTTLIFGIKWSYLQNRSSWLLDGLTACCQQTLSLMRLGHSLRRIVEELLLRDAFAFPALIGKFLHMGISVIQPFEVKYPADHHVVAIYKNGANALRRHR